MKSKKIMSISAGLIVMAVLVMSIPVLAKTNTSLAASNSIQGRMMGGQYGNNTNRITGMMRSGITGNVTAINGTSITLSGHSGYASTTPSIIYTIDAANAIVKKNNATSTLSSIVVGDILLVQGTVSGTNITATAIYDGVIGLGMIRSQGDENKITRPRTSTSTPMNQFLGNGQPVVAGTISAISGSTITVTTSSNVTYTVDATAAKILQGQSTITLSNISIGNKILIQGVVNGTSITASTIVDQSASTTGMMYANNDNNANNVNNNGKPRGMFASIGQFFMHMFGF